ncbi:hypothetical protein NECAME_02613 [Necator americanus]|uniref:Uncharacterized protein n=1 Tax=Necator americanus TaxID=51031 RepID=W2TD21_NECAM|nr:hypothetical protein NECAME_02613 [Necator americanus]ETN79494.1 hypothetical protein NECAME_02613 [Necator americanus]
MPPCFLLTFPAEAVMDASLRIRANKFSATTMFQIWSARHLTESNRVPKDAMLYNAIASARRRGFVGPRRASLLAAEAFRRVKIPAKPVRLAKRRDPVAAAQAPMGDKVDYEDQDADENSKPLQVAALFSSRRYSSKHSVRSVSSEDVRYTNIKTLFKDFCNRTSSHGVPFLG